MRGKPLGEGEYEHGEAVIHQLLIEAGISGLDRRPALVAPRAAELPAHWANLRSPETYIRYDGAGTFVSPGGAALDPRRVYTLPQRLNLNRRALAGDWAVREQGAVLHRANGRIAHRFHARDLYLVTEPAIPGTTVRFRVLIDSQSPGTDRGIDIDEQGNGTVTEPRLYLLIRQPGLIADRQFEIEFLDPGAQAFAFTFG